MIDQKIFNDIVREFLKRNLIEDCDEPYVKNFKQKLGKFLGQPALKNNKIMSDFLLEMLKSYKYYSEELIKKILCAFYEDFVCKQLFEHQTIFSSIPSEKDPSRTNSSDFFLNYFLNVNRIASSQSLNLNSLFLSEENKHLKRKNSKDVSDDYYKIQKLNHINTIVFIDDFSGSGKTIRAFLKNAKDILRNKEIHIFVIHLTQQAKLRIEDSFVEFNYKNAYLHFQDESDKIFNDERGKVKGINRSELFRFEDEIIGSKYPLGFSKCESLVTFYRNSPNNTISSFWWEYNKWLSLFPRKDTNIIDFHGYQQLKINVIENLKNIIPPRLQRKINFNKVIYLLYLKNLSINKNLEEIEIKKILGYTENQLLELEKTLVLEGFLKRGNELNHDGLKYLKRLKLFNVLLMDLVEVKQLEKSSDGIDRKSVYIPRKFS